MKNMSLRNIAEYTTQVNSAFHTSVKSTEFNKSKLKGDKPNMVTFTSMPPWENKKLNI